MDQWWIAEDLENELWGLRYWLISSHELSYTWYSISPEKPELILLAEEALTLAGYVLAHCPNPFVSHSFSSSYQGFHCCYRKLHILGLFGSHLCMMCVTTSIIPIPPNRVTVSSPSSESPFPSSMSELASVVRVYLLTFHVTVIIFLLYFFIVHIWVRWSAICPSPYEPICLAWPPQIPSTLEQKSESPLYSSLNHRPLYI